MFEKLINTKPERELCLKFLGFLKEKGLLNNDANPEETVTEFFDIDLEQAEDERKILVNNSRLKLRACGNKQPALEMDY